MAEEARSGEPPLGSAGVSVACGGSRCTRSRALLTSWSRPDLRASPSLAAPTIHARCCEKSTQHGDKAPGCELAAAARRADQPSHDTASNYCWGINDAALRLVSSTAEQRFDDVAPQTHYSWELWDGSRCLTSLKFFGVQ